MPVEAFADLWRTIKDGTPWTGMVKNRCKNGDYYWVLANMTPVIEQGRPVGYMSVRTKPSRQQVAEADALYRQFKAGNPQRLRFVNGRAVSTGVLARLGALGKLSFSRHVALNAGFMTLMMAVFAVAFWQIDGSTTDGARMALTAAAGLSALVMLYFWHSLQRTVAGPLRRATSAARKMAGGDLTGVIEVPRDDEMGQLLAALRQTNINLHSIIGDVRRNFDEIALATGEIASGNLDLSGRTESQASSLQQTAASMEQLTTNVQQSAGSVASANALAGRASRVAEQGGAIVSRVVHTMDEISTSSRKI
ncbi:MAG TPA: HAMP domain-containing protein [Burkholderiaceae bacterium]|nr:HAMP domain-containing protein [Burkholderiaceae bacterium]